MRDESFMTLMRLLPKSALSTAVGTATRAPVPAIVHQLAMRAFARRYDVAVDEAEHDFSGYSTFSEFFARRLKPGLRPIVPGNKVVVSPVDGRVSQLGYAEGGRCIQAKGIDFPLDKLLQDDLQARRFEGGAYATIYLSPRDYHRIHTPLEGQIDGYAYLPGEFWPVNASSVRLKEALFCLNERLTTYLTTPLGRVALVAVGATCVSRIRASYDEVMTHQGEPERTHHYSTPIPIQKGDELARFEMGSTVILLFEKGRMRWDEGLVPERAVRMGERLGGAP